MLICKNYIPYSQCTFYFLFLHSQHPLSICPNLSTKLLRILIWNTEINLSPIYFKKVFRLKKIQIQKITQQLFLSSGNSPPKNCENQCKKSLIFILKTPTNVFYLPIFYTVRFTSSPSKDGGQVIRLLYCTDIPPRTCNQVNTSHIKLLFKTI